MNIEQLDQAFSLTGFETGQVGIVEGEGGFPFIQIINKYARALISLYGGQVLSFTRHYEAADTLESDYDWLFVSRNAYYEQGKAIKGGIPVCWPWFGPDPEGQGRAAHGFVRNRLWTLLETAGTGDGSTRIRLGLEDTAETRAIWPHAFRLTLEITIGRTLRLELLTQNTSEQAFTITQALHTYFGVLSEQTRVHGLEGRQYIDKLAGEAVCQQQGPVTISSEVDRIYLAVPSQLTITDNSQEQVIRIKSSGANTAIVWNPWADTAAKMPDLQDDDYRFFVCVETANAADDVVEIPAGGEHRLTVEYAKEPVKPEF